MDDLSDLYQELIMDHNARPRNFGELSGATHYAEGKNPLCGDHVVVQAVVDDQGRLAQLKFSGRGCAISKASASLMTDCLRGKTLAEAEATFGRFHAMVTGPAGPTSDGASLGKLAALGGVRAFPMRVKCATLAWHTLRAALQRDAAAVCTE